MRTEFTRAIKVAAFERARGQCQDCTAKLFPGNIEYDHDIPDALGGEATLENCIVRCRACHKLKTTKRDVPAIAKAKEREASNINARTRKSPPMPGSRGSGWRHRMDGTWERRT